MLVALKRALTALENDPAHPVPTGVVSALAALAVPGTRLRLDVAASEQLGAPLISVDNTEDLDRLFAPLTARQGQVCRLLLKGMSNREIAAKLQISIATVKDHVHAILTALEVPSRSALIAATRPTGED